MASIIYRSVDLIEKADAFGSLRLDLLGVGLPIAYTTYFVDEVTPTSVAYTAINCEYWENGD